MIAGLRLSVSLLTIVPVRAADAGRTAARQAMLLAPATGLIVGAAAAVPLLLGPAGLDPLPRAVLAVAAMALVTRALHLDGLADLADGLGSARPPAEALAIMKRSDIGPFGVVTLLLALLLQAAALASTPDAAAAVMIAAVGGRLALPWACRTGVPSARPGGLGALVAGTISTRAALATTVPVLLAAALTGAVTELGSVRAVLAVSAALLVAHLMLRHAVRRLGGVTGDVLGALVELAATAALLVLSAA
ncbi:adenosylcobinamide-GDP ribazoletransferase [Actinomadura sp. 21ATH]|uniref:adenosylcobinamide-GDP ribazoletransferase n=1 Tax=Actinomadura sp. 21ATH TaxID=1735444 RepID=UPI0035C1ADF6